MKSFIRPFVLALALGPLSVMAADLIDINSADALTLQQINGIGPAKAQAIVEYRGKHGAFKSVDELENVPGIGPKMMTTLKPQVTLKAAQAAGKK
ncbi:MAG: helix-hairpin-helix domain-containing protein [Pseudomonadota bacterium]